MKHCHILTIILNYDHLIKHETIASETKQKLDAIKEALKNTDRI